MPLHFGQRWHAFTNGLFRSRDATEVSLLHHRVAELFRSTNLIEASNRKDFIIDLTANVSCDLGLEPGDPLGPLVYKFIARLLDYEDLLILPNCELKDRRSIAEWWALRLELERQEALVKRLESTRSLLLDTLVEILTPFLEAIRSQSKTQEGGQDIRVQTRLVDNVPNLGASIENTLAITSSGVLEEGGLFTRLWERLELNLIVASGGNPADPKNFNRAPKLPTKSDIKGASSLVEVYFGGTPLFDLLHQDIDFLIPTSARFEHHHIVAGSGHGKTQTLQYMIAKDLEAVAAGNRTVIVLDSQGDLIRNISELSEFAPGAPLYDRVVIIDPTDVEWPVSLNLFDVGLDRLSGYDALERERLTNSILELYDFVLGSLLSAEMTQKQSVIFRYVTRLMLHIPDATIHTLRDLMEPGSKEAFSEHIAKLSGSARHFFETEFASKEFEQTKKQVLRRLWGILENQTFERMFSHPRSKLDLFKEMNAGKVILINTAKDLLKEQGTEIFGRFFIAMIAQAAQERAALPKAQRIPTIVYVDEAADYFDRNIGIILAQARKYNVGMVLAHQYLGQLDSRLQEALAANTSIKFAGGVSAKDARTLAPQLYTEPSFIESQPKGSFAAHIRGVTKSAVPLHFPFGYLEALPKMSAEEKRTLVSRMRGSYSIHISKLADPQPKDQSPNRAVGTGQTTAMDEIRDTQSLEDRTEAGLEL